MAEVNPRAVLIAGPTASGKSALALALAERIGARTAHAGAVVVNADSMQVYRELRILTARPSAAKEARAPHALYGHVPVTQAYSAGRYMRDAEAAINAAWQSSRIPIVVGGTGLYFKALLEGLAPIPPIPEDIREHWRAEAGRLGAARLHEILKTADPLAAARLLASDTQRIVRALEVAEATGRSIVAWQSEPGRGVLSDVPAVRVVVTPERQELYRRCDARFAAMLRDGALDEARSIGALGLDPALPATRALGLEPLQGHLMGQIDIEAATTAAQVQTRQYAKRQITWLKRNMISWQWRNLKQMESLIDEIMQFIQA